MGGPKSVLGRMGVRFYVCRLVEQASQVASAKALMPAGVYARIAK